MYHLLFPYILALQSLALDCTGDSALSLGCISNRLTGGALTIINLLLAIAFVSGWGFVVAAIFKFKQVRDNPQQVPVSTPFAFLLTAILLIFLPGLMDTGSQTMFGSSEGGGTVDLIGQQASRTGLLSSTDNVSVQVIDPTASSTMDQMSIFGMAARVTDLFPTLMIVITGGAYLAGLGFTMAAMVKLKAVKDAPQQNPVTVPIAYLTVAILLVFMPDLLSPTSETLFGTGAEGYEAGASGQGSSVLVSDTNIQN